MAKLDVKRQAKLLAAENRRAEPDIRMIYWFPHEKEVRLLELTPTIPASGDGRVHPFHFQPKPDLDLHAPSGIALIRPDEFGKLDLPTDWGDWGSAVPLNGEDED